MSKQNFGLVGNAKEQLVKRFLARRNSQPEVAGVIPRSTPNLAQIPEKFCRFDKFPGYEKVAIPQAAARKLGIENPYFKMHDGVADATTIIGGKPYINFSSYNYLGLSGDPRVNQAAKDAIDRYGTSASASRLVAGERPIQRELEEAIAGLYDVDDCIVFVSGHATNVTTIATLFGPKDLIVHDSLIHNSVFEGIRLSGATRRAFNHNDPESLERVLTELRGNFERTLIVVEGLYSMDGDIPDLPRFIDIKQRYKAFLMVDEAHSIGVLGQTGRGIREHYGLPGNAVDIWMGTLSKAFASCGGYIAGERALIEHLKYAAPGFVYSVGIAPAMAAASLEAIRIMLAEPERLVGLRERATYFLEQARKHGIDTGLSQGYAVIPAIIGSSLKATKLSQQLFEQGINVQPIIHPAVEERAARLRFFISCSHDVLQISKIIALLV
ncbi:aminotransferase class I/II-fold pyridoxal phosphate-dependent enzyme [Dechloromonas sp. TW-R-39-2]|uniref:aminotransferase class I/II-fold pyridoxal phosphate-dependent enzyme n=1 Tax=Dechloromonas sp. TW-R-39-2 TaxID=2654218 RepID=UPI00193E0F66|nr:aminotransferase class I/II-fold pyridoxal phosphate-dependent enzyme [Dechloromonas sp. TW-R-39-2]QRM19926.1 aminotransferase class I/II-fold pyridoxal phosphate-dependent enzyme [Dechloromonas sp. TW-R-39-2]